MHSLSAPSMSVCIAVAVTSIASPLLAAPPAKSIRAVERESEAIRRALEANFQACNYEDVDALTATMAKSLPGISEFAKEAKDTFDQTDAYFRLADFELLEYRPPYATARVVQITLPKDEKDRTTGTDRQIFYRGHSGLLPQWECVEYLQKFEKVGGKWKVHAITTKPEPTVWPPANQPAR